MCAKEGIQKNGMSLKTKGIFLEANGHVVCLSSKKNTPKILLFPGGGYLHRKNQSDWEKKREVHVIPFVLLKITLKIWGAQQS